MVVAEVIFIDTVCPDVNVGKQRVVIPLVDRKMYPGGCKGSTKENKERPLHLR